MRVVLVPGLTDDPANVEGVARFVAPMKNVEWVEVLPFHQLGAFKWKSLGLEYQLADTPVVLRLPFDCRWVVSGGSTIARPRRNRLRVISPLGE